MTARLLVLIRLYLLFWYQLEVLLVVCVLSKR